MRLLELSNNYPTVTAEALMIPEFAALWKRDKNKNKDNAKTEIAYIYFILDFKSPYLAYSNEERESVIKKDLFKNENWKPDKEISDAMHKYTEMMETPVTRMLKSAFKGVDKLQEFLDNVDLDERTRSGGVVFKAGEVSKTIGDLDKVASSVKGLMDKAYQEEESFEKSRSGTMGGLLEFDGM